MSSPSPPSPSTTTTTTTAVMYPPPGAAIANSRTHFELFVSTRSRVIRVFNIPRGELNNGLLLSLLTSCDLLPSPSPSSSSQATSRGVLSLWALREEWGGRPAGEEESVWVAFRTHEQALMALGMIGAGNAAAIGCLPLSMLSATIALESDLEPTMKLRRVEHRRASIPSRQIHSISDLRPVSFYNLSSNPPTPPRSFTTANTSTVNSSNVAFRQGDWMCMCNAHNFMRNTLCIACNTPRHILSPSSSAPSQLTHFDLNDNPNHIPNSDSTCNSNKLPIILTPSGRALAIGGKVQNISRDPMAPCIIFWPQNEPFPEQRQIRPAIQYGSLPGSQPPPILNTGNKGPIEQQPGDWICGKCEYLNWRRRKVCQTCYPYAEGNTDGVSPTIQAERLAVLAQALGAHTQPTTQAQIPIQMSPAPSSLSVSTSTSTSTHSPRSSPSTSILSAPLPSPKSDGASDIISFCPPQQHVYRYPPQIQCNPHPVVLPIFLTEEEESRDEKDVKYYSSSLLVAPPTSNSKLSSISNTVPPNGLPTISSSSTSSAMVRRQSSLTFTPGYHHSPISTSASIWTMDQGELKSGLGLGLGLGFN